MWHFLKRQALYFLIGFVATFLIYLFVRFDADKVLLGMVIAAGGGIALAIALFQLERRFPEQPPAQG
jgi:cell division protein FtsW (lipid II flippase)